MKCVIFPIKVIVKRPICQDFVVFQLWVVVFNGEIFCTTNVKPMECIPVYSQISCSSYFHYPPFIFLLLLKSCIFPIIVIFHVYKKCIVIGSVLQL